MGTKAILIRYLERNRSTFSSDPLELRQQLAAVAERDGLKVTEEDLEEITGRPENGEPEIGNRKTEEPTPNPSREGNKKEGKRGDNSRRKSKMGDNTSGAI